jgi:hypothetical protein
VRSVEILATELSKLRAYAEEQVHARDIAEGFIREMADKIARDRNLNFDGKMMAVRNAIDLYEREIAGGQRFTDCDPIVEKALVNARRLVDAGRSGLAREALRRTAESLQKEEALRRREEDE